MKVKVIKCSNQKFWYFYSVGTEFVVSSFDKEDYAVINKFGDISYISRDDCRIVGTEGCSKENLESKEWYVWEDSFDGSGYVISTSNKAVIINKNNLPKNLTSKEAFKSIKQAKSALAFAQLSHIVSKYNEGKIKEDSVWKIEPVMSDTEFVLRAYNTIFPVHGDLYFYIQKDANSSMVVNADLWKQYWMIGDDTIK